MANVVRNKKSNRVLIGVIIFMFIALLAVTIAVIVISANRSSRRQNNDEIVTNTTDDEQSDDQVAQGEDGDQPADDETPAPGDETGNGEGEKKEVTGAIDYRGMVGNTLQIHTTINQSLSDGTCSLTLVGPNGQQYKATAQIIPNSAASTSTCNGFDVNMDQVEKKMELRAGKWTITIDLSTSEYTGQLTSEISL